MSISLLNEYCQKNKLTHPDYLFFEKIASGENHLERAQGDKLWCCSLIFNNKEYISAYTTTKQKAKEEVAQKACSSIKKDEKITLPNRIFMVDGDQRMDCWKWLASCDKGFAEIIVFASPTCPVIECPHIQIIKSKTTNRDSADAEMLMYLGRYLYDNPTCSGTRNKVTSARDDRATRDKIVIVSSDHILVQAAQDNLLSWAGNLTMLQDYVDSFSD